MRGSAQQLVEKYLQLARDAATAGDPVRAENYYQHAEHYYRLRNANGGGDRQPQRPGEQPRNGTGAGAEGETPAASAANGSDRGAAEEPEISAPGAEPAAKPEGAGDQVS